jgi:DNA-binding transcriptional MerR regulator
MASDPFTLAQLGRAVGMSVDEVRFYRDGGLLQPPRRLRSRTDDFGFGAAHVDRLRFIQRSLTYGYSLDEIARLVDRVGLTTCNDVYRLSVHRLEELRRDRGSSDAAALALEKLIATCARVGGRKDCQILDALSKDAASEMQSRRPWRPKSLS